MAMTITVTRNTPNRFDGFLNSCMHEIAPGVYVAPRMKKSVRERVWNVMMEWAEMIPEDGGVVLFWKTSNAPSGLGVRFVGWPKKELVEHEGVWLTHRNLTGDHDIDELQKIASTEEPAVDDDDPLLDEPT